MGALGNVLLGFEGFRRSAPADERKSTFPVTPLMVFSSPKHFPRRRDERTVGVNQSVSDSVTTKPPARFPISPALSKNHKYWV